MVWSEEKHGLWVLKRRKEYGMVCLKKGVIAQMQKLRLTPREAYSEIIQRLINNHSIHGYEEELKTK